MFPVFTDLERPAVAGEMICLRVFLGTPIKKTVNSTEPKSLDNDYDDLTRDELILHREAVTSAIATELKTWQHFKYFSRRAKQVARNVIHCRLVI